MKYRVDIDSANKAKNSLSGIIDGKDNRLINKVGAFSSLFQLDISKYKQPVLVLKTEEPGSKQVLAFKHDKIESVCYDMINHLINDCICMGAEPVAVQDLIICGTMDPAKIRRIVSACVEACQEQGCVLTGGETTQQPDVVPEGTYVLGSSIVGIVEKDNIIDGSAIAGGELLSAAEIFV
ncbi:MAG: AIR synthase related protein [Spirochaetia bacterium]